MCCACVPAVPVLGGQLVMLTAIITCLYALWIAMQELKRWKEEVKTIKTRTEADTLYDPKVQEHIIAREDFTVGKVLGEGAEGIVHAGTYAGGAQNLLRRLRHERPI